MNFQLKTDPGRVRSSNQDAMTAFTLAGQGVFAAVCDGMGGANGGNIASDMCIRILEQKIRTEYAPEMDERAVLDLMKDALSEANTTIYTRSVQEPELNGMGTTAVLILLRGTTLLIGNVGDSRAILFRGDDVHQLTKDHSYVQAMVDSGKITEEEALTHPQKNIITRAIGVQTEVEIDTFVHEFSDGDLLLLCSDGLTNELSYDRLQQLIQTTPRSGLAEELIAQANAAGGHDNSTVVLVEA